MKKYFKYENDEQMAQVLTGLKVNDSVNAICTAVEVEASVAEVREEEFAWTIKVHHEAIGWGYQDITTSHLYGRKGDGFGSIKWLAIDTTEGLSPNDKVRVYSSYMKCRVDGWIVETRRGEASVGERANCLYVVIEYPLIGGMIDTMMDTIEIKADGTLGDSSLGLIKY